LNPRRGRRRAAGDSDGVVGVIAFGRTEYRVERIEPRAADCRVDGGGDGAVSLGKGEKQRFKVPCNS